MYGLKEEDIQQIRSVFAQYHPVEKAIIYGSRALGTDRIASDIDITLIGTSIDQSVLVKVENKLDDLLLPYKIDLSLIHQIENASLLGHIQRVGKPIYLRKKPNS